MGIETVPCLPPLPYGLVKWSGGDDGKCTIVPTNNIRNFDTDKYLDGLISSEDEFVVEWGSEKWPKGGFAILIPTIQKIAGKIFHSSIESVKLYMLDSKSFCTRDLRYA